MAYIKPFAALRPVPNLVQDIASPPYDVMDDKEAREMAANKPLHFLHVLRSEIDLPEDVNPYDHIVYERAHQFLLHLIENGMMIRDAKPCYYVYRQIMNGRTQFGIVGCASVDEYQNNTIKKHELTRKDKQADRTRHIDIVNAQCGPIFLAYHGRPAINAIAEAIMQQEPLYDFVKNKHLMPVQHTAWRIDDDALIARIQQEFAAVECIYIADGHHRCAAASSVRDLRREASKEWTGQEEANYFLSVLFPAEQLHIMDYNRVVKDLNGLDKEAFLNKLEEKFTVENYQGQGSLHPGERHEVGMYLDKEWYRLRMKPGTFDESDAIASLDVSILQDNLLAPILGITDPTTDKRIRFVGGIRGLEELEQMVDNGAAVAFAMYPTSIEELFTVSDNNKQMPPKSTWFEPKLLSGLFVHELDEQSTT